LQGNLISIRQIEELQEALPETEIRHNSRHYDLITNERLAEMVANGEIRHDVTELNLSGNEISDLTPLATLTNLRSLDLSDNFITDLSPLAGLTNLGNEFATYVNLSYNQITDVSPLANLTNLQFLTLHNNQITDLTPLGNLIRLESHLAGLDKNPVTAEQIDTLNETLRQRRASMDRAVLTFGHILGIEPYTVSDALAILRYCVGLPSVLDDCPVALMASLIVSEENPGMSDALEILRSLVGLPNALTL
jgi:Leucine-rich repeat (LRR) protein